MNLQPYIPSADQWMGNLTTSRRPYIHGRQNRVGPNYYIHHQTGGSKPSVKIISPTTQTEDQAKSNLKKLRTTPTGKSIKQQQSRRKFSTPANVRTVKKASKSKKAAKKTSKKTVKKTAKKTAKKTVKKKKKTVKDILGN